MAYSRKIEIQLLTEAKDEIGQDVSSWETLFRPWADIDGVGSKEYYAAAQSNSECDMTFKIRYSRLIAKKLTSEIRVIYNGLIYDVKQIYDYKEQHRQLVIRARQLNGGVHDE